jgi:lysophospholipase L1-like esterase
MRMPKFSLSITRLVAAGLLLPGLILASEPPKRTPESAITPCPLVPKHEDILNAIKAQAKTPIDLVFFGDSITDFWPGQGPDSWKKMAPYHPADFGVSSERTEHMLWRLEHGELENIHPKVFVIMAGTNNLGHWMEETPEYAAAGITAIVKLVHQKLPDTTILLLGIFPRDNKTDSMRGRVATVNEIISHLADGKKIRYMDLKDKFLDANGNLLPGAFRDGLHPTAAGYEIWYDAIQPTLDQLMK